MDHLTRKKKPVDVLNDAKVRLSRARDNQRPNDAIIVASLAGTSLALAASLSVISRLIAGTEVEPGQWFLLTLGLLFAPATWVSGRVFKAD